MKPELIIDISFALTPLVFYNERIIKRIRKSKSSTSALKTNIFERQVVQSQYTLLSVKDKVLLRQFSQYMLFGCYEMNLRILNMNMQKVELDKVIQNNQRRNDKLNVYLPTLAYIKLKGQSRTNI